MEKINIKQLAVDFAGNRNLGFGHGYPSHTAILLEKGYLHGFKACKDHTSKQYANLLIELDAEAKSFIPAYESTNIYKQIEIIKMLLNNI